MQTPGVFTPPVYGRHSQPAVVDESPALPPEQVHRLQEIVGVFLYYARAVDATLLRKITQLSSAQSFATEQTAQQAAHFLQYAGQHPDAGITYFASVMQLTGHTDGSYLCEEHGRSRAGAPFFLSTDPGTSDQLPLVNGPLLCISKMFDVVLASAAETEYGALFLGCQEAEILRTTLADLGHPQGATPMQCDNKCAVGLANETVKERMSKAIDMRFHWTRDRIRQGHFRVFWKRGVDNLADYFTKEHPVRHCRNMRHFFVTDPVGTTSYSTPGRLKRLVHRSS